MQGRNYIAVFFANNYIIRAYIIITVCKRIQQTHLTIDAIWENQFNVKPNVRRNLQNAEPIKILYSLTRNTALKTIKNNLNTKSQQPMIYLSLSLPDWEKIAYFRLSIEDNDDNGKFDLPTVYSVE
jgi:hypothetical protein